MTTLPPSSDFTTTGITKGAFKTALTSLRSYLSGLLGDAGSQAAALSGLGAPLNGTLSKTAAYTVVAADRGKLIDCTTGTWTLALDPAATLGAGFVFGFRNSGSGTITINPNLSEPINSATTLQFGPGESGLAVCDGTGWKTISGAADGQFQSVQVFAASGTWTHPVGLKRVKVTVVGGGGGGGGAYGGASLQGGGGGGGGASVKTIEASALGGSETVTVGGGGAGAAGATNSPGGTGSTSSFGAHCSATGGPGGASSTSAPTSGGAGGTGSGGGLNISGGGGGTGNSNTGGSSILGGGGKALTGVDSAGVAGGVYGGGGGGAPTAGGNNTGGAGAAGVVVIEEFF